LLGHGLIVDDCAENLGEAGVPGSRQSFDQGLPLHAAQSRIERGRWSLSQTMETSFLKIATEVANYKRCPQQHVGEAPPAEVLTPSANYRSESRKRQTKLGGVSVPQQLGKIGLQLIRLQHGQFDDAMQAGRWKTNRMPMRYGEHALAARGAMAKAAEAQGRDWSPTVTLGSKIKGTPEPPQGTRGL